MAQWLLYQAVVIDSLTDFVLISKPYGIPTRNVGDGGSEAGEKAEKLSKIAKSLKVN